MQEVPAPAFAPMAPRMDSLPPLYAPHPTLDGPVPGKDFDLATLIDL